MRGRNLNLIAFILICGSISYFDMKKCHRLPWPPRFIFAGLTFLMMELITMVDETLGGVTAIGFFIAIFINNGFVKNCAQEFGDATTHPQTAAFMGDYTGPQQGIASVAEFQQQQQGGSTQQGGTAATPLPPEQGAQGLPVT